ncbi:hypothetical protein Pfo_029697 [Paulownia fortunei]|nr:hypothetical protein Pfo_029697 [Paulownia fortunei]
MEDLTRRGRMGELNLASRRAEEAALRRYQAVHWLDYLVGPLGIPSQPSEKEFISCLRNGLILCNVINKIQTGSVPKVIENTSPLQSLPWDSQPLPAYQYFENVRNFLVAVEELKLPNFEASVFERGSSTKVVDCILALKDYHEWKQMTGGNGLYKPPRSPLIVHSAGRIHARSPALVSYDSSRQLDMSGGSNKPMPSATNYNFSKVLVSNSPCLKKGNCNHWNLVEQQERELLVSFFTFRGSVSSLNILHVQFYNIKLLLSSAKQEVESLQSQLQSDLKQLGDQVLEMSSAALGYHKAVKENRNLYNMVQDLKGNIRVYCRIRPALNPEVQNVIDFVGKEGSLVVIDPKPLKDGKKIFQFNRVFGPTATQDEVFRDTQPLVRSVMDGYNVCIFAYGQTGSGKTHTMYGPPGGSAKELGISYLALNDLFGLSDQRKDITKYEIQVQMVEIYNEQVRDLLAEDSGTRKYPFTFTHSMSCVSNNNNLALPDATLHPVKSTVDVINLMKLSEVNRAVGSSAINIRSSRSHSILSVHVQGEDASGSILRSCLHLVDLAGSEQIEKSEVTGDGLREAPHINDSLACLVDVITALAQKNSHIPYRNSKLTLLLQNSLGGNAKTLMFAHVNPERDSFGETLSTLKFAQRVSTVELGAARGNKESSEVLELKAQPIKPEVRCLQNHSQLEDGKSITKICGQQESRGSLLDLSNQRAPRSPLSSALKSPVVKIDTATMKGFQLTLVSETKTTLAMPIAISTPNFNYDHTRQSNLCFCADGNENRNAKTPPQVRASAKFLSDKLTKTSCYTVILVQTTEREKKNELLISWTIINDTIFLSLKGKKEKESSNMFKIRNKRQYPKKKFSYYNLHY